MGFDPCNHTLKIWESTETIVTPLWTSVRMKLTLPKLGTWSPPRLPKI